MPLALSQFEVSLAGDKGRPCEVQRQSDRLRRAAAITRGGAPMDNDHTDDDRSCRDRDIRFPLKKRTEYVAMNFRVPFKFRRQFKLHAMNKGLSMHQLFFDCFSTYLQVQDSTSLGPPISPSTKEDNSR